MSRLLTMVELNKLKGISYCRSQLHRLEQLGRFPRRVKLGDNSVRWDEAEIDAYLNAKRAARPAPPPPPRPFRRVKRRA